MSRHRSTSILSLILTIASTVISFIVVNIAIIYAGTIWPQDPSGSTPGGIYSEYLRKILDTPAISTYAGDGTVKNSDRLDGLDGTIFQRRIKSSCPSGEYMVQVQTDGSVVCSPPIPPNSPSCRVPRPTCITTGGCDITANTPTLANQEWTQGGNNCGFTCTNGFTGNQCEIAPAAPTCTDGIQNQGETGVDCGGPCGACQSAPKCYSEIDSSSEASVSDCLTDVQARLTTGWIHDPSAIAGASCTSSALVDRFCGGSDKTYSWRLCGTQYCGGGGSCTDGIQNQGETGVDCGGPCGACGGGTCTWIQEASPSCGMLPAKYYGRSIPGTLGNPGSCNTSQNGIFGYQRIGTGSPCIDLGFKCQCQGTNYSCSTNTPACNGTGCELTPGTPTSANQAWVKGASSCGFTCKNGYSGDWCEIPPQNTCPADGQLENGVCIRMNACKGTLPNGTSPTNFSINHENKYKEIWQNSTWSLPSGMNDSWVHSERGKDEDIKNCTFFCPMIGDRDTLWIDGYGSYAKGGARCFPLENPGLTVIPSIPAGTELEINSLLDFSWQAQEAMMIIMSCSYREAGQPVGSNNIPIGINYKNLTLNGKIPDSESARIAWGYTPVNSYITYASYLYKDTYGSGSIRVEEGNTPVGIRCTITAFGERGDHSTQWSIFPLSRTSLSFEYPIRNPHCIARSTTNGFIAGNDQILRKGQTMDWMMSQNDDSNGALFDSSCEGFMGATCIDTNPSPTRALYSCN